MCIKIICEENIQEFNPGEPLENQVAGAKEILVEYDELDPRIDHFMDGLECMANSGIGCNAEIKVDTKNKLNGIKLERALEKLKTKLEVNEVIKGLAKLHADTDQKLCEISDICLGKN